MATQETSEEHCHVNFHRSAVYSHLMITNCMHHDEITLTQTVETQNRSNNQTIIVEEPDKWKDETKRRSRKRIKSKKPKNHHEENDQIKKKPRMKTARDVINRIKWDEAIDPEFISVIYWDRHYGMTKIKFGDLNWTDEIACTGPEDALVLPEHRIYTFIWKSQVVWDRKKRIDRVFGSLGESKRIQDIINE